VRIVCHAGAASWDLFRLSIHYFYFRATGDEMCAGQLPTASAKPSAACQHWEKSVFGERGQAAPLRFRSPSGQFCIEFQHFAKAFSTRPFSNLAWLVLDATCALSLSPDSA